MAGLQLRFCWISGLPSVVGGGGRGVGGGFGLSSQRPFSFEYETIFYNLLNQISVGGGISLKTIAARDQSTKMRGLLI